MHHAMQKVIPRFEHEDNPNLGILSLFAFRLHSTFFVLALKDVPVRHEPNQTQRGTALHGVTESGKGP